MKKIIRGTIIFIVIGLLFAGIGILISIKSSGGIVSPVPDDSPANTIFSFFSPAKKPEDLQKKLIKSIGTTLKNYSVLVTETNSDFTVSINENEIFAAASINKIPILAALYYLSQKGDVDLDEVITVQPEDIQDYGTGSIRYDPPKTTYSIKTLARLMMQKSDNTAAYILARQIIGIQKLQNIIDSWGLSQTFMEENKTSNADMELLMKRIYTGKIVNQALTLEMLSFLKDGEFEDRISKYLPDNTIVYHKTGNGVGFIHDVGIVVTPKSTYYIGLFTSDVSDEETTTELLAKLSKTVYDFMK